MYDKWQSFEVRKLDSGFTLEIIVDTTQWTYYGGVTYTYQSLVPSSTIEMAFEKPEDLMAYLAELISASVVPKES
jgi:hypothetical protein